MQFRGYDIGRKLHPHRQSQEVANIGLLVGGTEADNAATALRNQVLQTADTSGVTLSDAILYRLWSDYCQLVESTWCTTYRGHTDTEWNPQSLQIKVEGRLQESIAAFQFGLFLVKYLWDIQLTFEKNTTRCLLVLEMS